MKKILLQTSLNIQVKRKICLHYIAREFEIMIPRAIVRFVFVKKTNTGSSDSMLVG